MAASVESVPAPQKSEQETTSQAQQKGGGSSSGGSGDLRTMSYDEGAAALAPGGDPNDPDGGPPPLSEKQEVAQVHELTIDVLQDKIKEVAGITVRKNGKVRNRKHRAKKKSAERVKEIFAFLGQFDSQTITAAWQNVKDEAATAFDETIDAIGYKDAARAYPREARATLKAADDAKLAEFAQGCLKKNAFAAELAANAMSPDASAAFRAAHPELAEKVTVDEHATMSDEVIGSQDIALRAKEEAYRDKAKADDVAQRDEAEQAKEDTKDKGSPAADLMAAVTGLIDGGKAPGALRKLTSTKDDGVFTAAVHALDGSGKLATLLTSLSFDEKWNVHPALVRRVLAARSSDKNIADALKILDLKSNPRSKKVVHRQGGRKVTRSVKRKEINSVEAYAAYHYLKALPAGHRDGFRKAYPALITAMETHLNDSMRGADDTNFHGADGSDKAGTAKLLAKIQDIEFWASAAPGEIEMTLKLALKTGAREAISEQLEAMGRGGALAELHADSGRRAAVEAALGTDGEAAAEGLPPEQQWLASLKLTQTITQDDKDLAGNHSWLKAVGVISRGYQAQRAEVRQERKDYREAKRNGEDVDKPTTEKHNLLGQMLGGQKQGFVGDNIALDQLQDVVDNFGAGTDAQFKDYGKRSGDNQHEDRNRADVRYDPNQGVMEFKSGSLELVSFRFPMGDMTIETGPVTMKDLELLVTWPTAHNPTQQSGVSITASVIDINSLVLTGPGMLLGIQQINATGIDITAAEAKADFSDNPGAADALKLLMKHNPARTLIGNYMKGNIEAQTPAVQEAFSGIPAGAQGGVSLKIDSLEFKGVTQNTDTYVAKAGITGLELLQDSRPSVHSTARVAQLNKMVTKAQGQLAAIPDDAQGTDRHKRERLLEEIARWQAEVGKLQAALPEWKALEALYQEVYENLRLQGSQSAHDEAIIADLRGRAAAAGIPGADSMSVAEIAKVAHAKLKDGAGAVLSLDKVSAEGVRVHGTVVDEANVTDVNVAGTGDAMGSALNPKMINRLGGTGKGGVAGDTDQTAVDAHIGTVEVKGLAVVGGRGLTMLLERAVDTRTKLRGTAPEKLTEAERKTLAGLEARWIEVLPDGRSFGEVTEAMVAMYRSPGIEVIEKDAELLARWNGYENALKAQAITLESLTIEGIQAGGKTEKDGDGFVGTSALSVGEVKAKGFKSGAMQVGEATVTDVNAKAQAKLDKDGNPVAVDVAAGVGGITAKDVALDDGTKLDDASVAGVKVAVHSDKDGSSFDLKLAPITTSGVGLKTGEAAAEAKILRLTAEIEERVKSGKAHAELDASLQDTRDGLKAYAAAYGTQAEIKQEIAGVDEQIDAAKGRLRAAEAEAAVQKHVEPKKAAARDKALIETYQAQLKLLAARRDEIAKKLVKPNALIASYESSLGLSGEASLKGLEVSVTTTAGIDQLKTGDASGTYKLDLKAGPIAIPAVHYAAPGMDLVMGSASMAALACKASVTVVRHEKTEAKPVSYEITQVNVDSFTIPEIAANELKLTMGVEGEAILIELPTASIKGVSLTDVKIPGLTPEAFKAAEGKFNLAEVNAKMNASMGDSMQANGELTLSNIHATALSSGAVNFGMDALSLEQLGFKSKETKEGSGGKSIVSQIVSIGGKATRLGKVDINGSYDRKSGELKTTVGMDDLVLSGVNYAGGGTYMGIGYADMKGASVTIGAKFKSGKLEKGESAVEELWLDRLHIDRIYGKNISYKGKGKRRERFGNGQEKVTTIEQAISLKRGTLHGVDVKRMRLDDYGGLAMSLGSASVKGLEVGMKENGKQTLQANVSAKIQSVALSMVDDDLTLKMASLDGDADVTMGEGEGATHVGIREASVTSVGAKVHSMGKADQTTEADIGGVKAKRINFGTGVRNSGMGEAHALGTAQLDTIHISDNKDRTKITIKSGEGEMIAGLRSDGYTKGTYDAADAGAITNDQVKVPQYKMTWEMGILSKLNGGAKVKYPDGKTFLALDFEDSIVKLNTDDNIKQMWSSWCSDIYSGGEVFNMGAWQNRWDAITNIDNNVLWTMLFKGVEYGFNTWGESILGKWVNVEKMVVDALNGNPKTTTVDAKEQSFFNLQTEINKVIEEYVDPTIQKVCDYGVAYDAVKGNYGRAAKDAGLWIWDKVVDTAEWATGQDYAANDYAEEERERIRKERELECKRMVDQFLNYVMGWGVDVDLNSTGGGLTAAKTPYPNPKKTQPKTVISSMMDVHAKGAGSLAGGFALNASGVLSDFEYNDSGTSVKMDKIVLNAGAKAGIKKTYDEDAGRYTDMDPMAVAGARVRFSGLSFEMDKNYKRTDPKGVVSQQDYYAQHGNNSAIGQPTSDGSTTTYDAADYAKKQSSQSGATAQGAQLAKSWESSAIAGRNASVGNKYELIFQDPKKKKKPTGS